ncbi:PTP 1 [Bracoviriform demolitoris]|uniref:Tyrosine phosphatase-like protein J1 n=1 Tax=Microplitis demolitor bracovirus (isolate Webb) TaxID=654919 RepID=PTPJ1_MDBVW|nr:tyrosine-protein phosphatase non-receptor type 9 [Microplitis demolitor]YP_239387.1 PTP 1 [Bracoviriform demolitoris]Q5I141.1 RecName: Full=Tyrosine phosphatase-like protein J1; Short=PTP-J1 [Microplitis demolitor bracovirus (isolate Webb)]AAW51795.1 PTP 1 [Bracoviriform demolitoris]KAG6558340.1 protein tyrosine phosphatase J1 [Microplitis demolitor]
MGSHCSKNRSCRNYVTPTQKSNVREILKREHEHIMQGIVAFSCNISLENKNMKKNRYPDAPCFDYNRVVLPIRKGLDDYINASYVDGHNMKRRFICTQGPLEETALDFWQAVYQDRVRVIVMITKTYEDNKQKCYPYWMTHERSTVTYGELKIRTKKIKSFRNYKVTTLCLTNTNTGTVLDIKHFAYEDWPQGGVPSDVNNFLDFVLAVRHADSKTEVPISSESRVKESPILVHSSAGLDRAPAFCVIDICISKYSESAIIPLLTTVRDLRRQRNNCLSLSTQYIFCYFTVLQFVMSTPC